MSHFKAKMHQISAGTPPQTPLGSLQRPHTPSCIWGTYV